MEYGAHTMPGLSCQAKLIRFYMQQSRLYGHPKDSPQKMKINGRDWEVLFLAHSMNNPLQHVRGLAFQVNEGKHHLKDKGERNTIAINPEEDLV